MGGARRQLVVTDLRTEFQHFLVTGGAEVEGLILMHLGGCVPCVPMGAQQMRKSPLGILESE